MTHKIFRVRSWYGWQDSHHVAQATKFGVLSQHSWHSGVRDRCVHTIVRDGHSVLSERACCLDEPPAGLFTVVVDIGLAVDEAP